MPWSNLEGERYAALRLLRATKNRFGSTDEVGVFEMAETGLLEVADPARAFLADHGGSAPGSVVAPTLEGSRPLLVEVQALVSPTAYGTPSRKASGLDPNRLSLLIAVLGRRAGIAPRQPRRLRQPGRRAVGGRAGARPAARARPRIVVARPARSPPGPSRSARSGCSGELRAVVGLERRLREAARLGFDRRDRPAAVGRRRRSPRSTASTSCAVATLRDAIEAALDRPTAALVARRSRRC